MTRSQPKAHTISQEDSAWTLAVPTVLVLVVLVSIVLLGLLGEAEATRREAHAKEPASESQVGPAIASPEEGG